MAKDNDFPLTAREVLTQLIDIRRSWPRSKAAAGLKTLAEALEPYAKTLLAAAGGADHARAETARAIISLQKLYRDKEKSVPDGIWATAVNAAYRWRDIEGE